MMLFTIVCSTLCVVYPLPGFGGHQHLPSCFICPHSQNSNFFLKRDFSRFILKENLVNPIPFPPTLL